MHILIIEDSEGDQRILKEAFRRVDPKIQLTFVVNADLALQELKTGKTPASKASFILLDLNLPKKSGKEFLKELKAHEEFKRIPVLVLTSSQAEIDINECYGLGASCYLRKPMKFQEFQQMVESICAFWAKEVTYSTSPRTL